MRAVILPLLLATAVPAGAQDAWNDSVTMVLVHRAIERRERTIVDSGLVDYTAQARGFVFFLGQLGEGLSDPPQLIKSDQLAVEVYWKAPNLSKQRIIGWRDRRDLPSDIRYHRDHLGIVQNNFGNMIRLGEGDEVRDVPHPLSPMGPRVYDYQLRDSLRITIPQRTVSVLEIAVRPRDFGRPRLVGSIYIDAEQYDLVRMAFNFTAAAYLDRQLEDISIVLDHSLWEGRFWLPYRQEIEIRRRATWLELPARGIIRGRWEIGDYTFNVGLPDGTFRGPEIVAAPAAVRDTFAWREPLDAAVEAAVIPIERQGLTRLRTLTARIASQHALSGLPPARIGVGRISDVVRANRVEGLALGAGVIWRPSGPITIQPRIGYGVSDGRVKGKLAVRLSALGVDWEVEGHRTVRDVADEPPVSRLVNSVSAQEFGRDAGDYYLATGGSVAGRFHLGTRRDIVARAGVDRVNSLRVQAAPAFGAFRPNPALGSGSAWTWTELAVRQVGGVLPRGETEGSLALEVGALDGSYWRARGAGTVRASLGLTQLVFDVEGGVGSRGLPPHRAFVLGGRGTLLGEPYRAWGGRYSALGAVEWRIPVTWLDFRVASYGTMRRSLTLAPYVAAGWASRPVAGTPWRATPGLRPVAGVGLDWLRLVRLDLGIALRTGRFGAAVDVTRALWEIL